MTQPAQALTDEDVARAEITRHYEQRVTKARAELDKMVAELQRKLAAAETARTVWQTSGEITSSSPVGNPRAEYAVESEVMGILLTADEPYDAAVSVAFENPGDADRHLAVRQYEARVQAVTRWLGAHGHQDNPAVKTRTRT